MSRTPVETLENETGVDKREDETVREYVERVGAANDVSDAVVDGALAYITEWHYSDTPPADDEAFRTLVQQSRPPEELASEPSSVGSSPDSTSETAETDAVTQETTAPDTSPAPTATQRGASHGETAEQTPDEQEPQSTETAVDTAQSVARPDTAESPLSGFKTGIEGREPRTLLLRFLAIVTTAPVIGWMVARAWVPGNTLYDGARDLLVEVLGISGAAALDLVAVFGLGLYAALLALFLADVKKRVQGVLLLLGTVLSFTVVGVVGVFFPSLDFTSLTALGLVLGFGTGIAMESAQLLALDGSESSFKRPTLENGEIPEFRHAARLLFGLVAVVVVATLAQVAIAGELRVVDVPAVGVFLIVLYQFVQYESETSYVTLGPERSGKSMLLLGLCLELLNRAETHPNPNAYLQQGLERASNLQPDQAQWPIPSTAHDEVRAASFEVISGYYFPRRLELTALDYAGQHLGRIADVLATDTSPDPDGSVPHHVAARVADADTLFFILDIERLEFPEEFHEAGATDEANISWGLEHYTTIVEHADPDDVIVIATKCDILIDQGVVSSPSMYESFPVFADAVTDHLLARPDVQELLKKTNASAIHPVYFATEKRDGEYVPRLDTDGNLVPVGYNHLIDEIRNRQ